MSTEETPCPICGRYCRRDLLSGCGPTVSRERAVQLRDEWFRLYPEIQKVFDIARTQDGKEEP